MTFKVIDRDSVPTKKRATTRERPSVEDIAAMVKALNAGSMVQPEAMFENAGQARRAALLLRDDITETNPKFKDGLTASSIVWQSEEDEQYRFAIVLRQPRIKKINNTKEK